MGLRVLITNAPLAFYHRTAFFFRDQGAINLAILATMAAKKHTVKIVDNWHHVFRFHSIFEEIEKFKPHVLAMSHSSEVDTENVFNVIQILKRRYPHIRVVGGGQYPSMFPDHSLRNGFDVTVRGEGEKTFPELLDALEMGRPLREVAGISFLMNDRLVTTAPRTATPLSELPYPDVEFAPIHKSWYFPGKKATVIETARGCPFTCDFCIVTSFFNKKWQKRSNVSIIEQIKKLKYQKGVDHFYFIDESWGVRPHEYAEFCQMLIDEKLNIKWYPSGMRTDTIVKNPELVALAARAGMYGTLVGFESYNQKTLTDVHKQSSIQNNRLASEILRKNKIIVYGVHIYGLPGETNFLPTYKEGSRRSDVFCVSMFSCLPGTPLFERAEKQGLLEKIPKEKRLYPYSYFMGGEGRDRKRMTRAFMGWHLLYHISPHTIFDTFFSVGIRRRFKIADYISCFQYFFLMFLGKVQRVFASKNATESQGRTATSTPASIFSLAPTSSSNC